MSFYGTKTNYEMVKEFNDKFDVARRDFPSIPNDAILDLRLKLIFEEFTELCDEIDPKKNPEIDLCNVAKELADLLIVTYGMADALGLPMDRVFQEVHESNMTKLGDDGKPIRREDGKVLKSKNYVPPDLSWLK